MALNIKIAPVLLLLAGINLFGQTTALHSNTILGRRGVKKITVQAVKYGNDTIPQQNLDEINIYGERQFKDVKKAKYYGRLKRDVKRVYPYAKLAGKKLRQYNDTLLTMADDKMRRKYMKEVEKEIIAEFEDDIRGLTFRQGMILLKLIDRETGNTSYSLVKELRGAFSAFFWQSIARLFGANLKSTYDGQEEDILIEEIIELIEGGHI